MRQSVRLFGFLLILELVVIVVVGWIYYYQLKALNNMVARDVLKAFSGVVLSKGVDNLTYEGRYLKLTIEANPKSPCVEPYCVRLKSKDKTIAFEYKPLGFEDLFGRFLDKLSLLFISLSGISFVFSMLITKKEEDMVRLLNSIIDDVKQMREPVFPHLEDKSYARLFYGIKKIYRIQKRQQEDLKKEKGRIDFIISSMGEGLMLLSSTGVIELVNPKAKELIFSDIEANKNILDVISHYPLLNYFSKLLEGGSSEEEIKIDNRWLLIKGKRIQDKIIVIISDITQKKEYAQMKAQFFADASHELKTPITSILGYSETLMENPDMDTELRLKFIRYINENAKELTELIEDILTLHRIESIKNPKSGRCDLKRIKDELEFSFGGLAKDKSLKFEIECPPVAVDIPCEYVKSILWNLTDNAIKYTESGFVSVSCFLKNSGLTIEVRDSGIGIAKEHLGNIFQRFYTTQKSRSRRLSGTGLGLAIVKHIVDLYSGRIEVYSKPQKGSTFRVFIPKRNTEDLSHKAI